MSRVFSLSARLGVAALAVAFAAFLTACGGGSSASNIDTGNPAGPGTPGDADWDGDGRLNAADNCPWNANYFQENRDGDGPSGDSHGDSCDNCPNVSNEDQADADRDGVGNSCDNCLNVANGNQADNDGDGVGNACED